MTSEAVIRLSLFAAIFSVIAVWELLAPRRELSVKRSRRWPANLGVLVLNTVLMRVLFPTALAGVATLTESRQWGLLHYLTLPDWLAFLATLTLLDLAIYAQHVAMHAVPALWRAHRMHHADLDFDVTTAGRFHPIEILISFGYKAILIVGLGASAGAVIAFEVILNGASIFNHGNIRLPPGLDRILRWAVVTPDMHRIHHSTVLEESNRNFGFSLSCWDRLWGTYQDLPRAGHQSMAIGLEHFRDPNELKLWRLLTQPFRSLQADANRPQAAQNQTTE